MSPKKLPPRILQHLQKKHAEQLAADAQSELTTTRLVDPHSTGTGSGDISSSPNQSRGTTSVSDAGYLKAGGRGRSKSLRAAIQQREVREHGAATGPAMLEKKEQAKNEKSIFAKAISSFATSIKSNPGTYVALGSVALSGWTALRNKPLPESTSPEQTKPANPSKVIDAYMRNGTFGTLAIDAKKINGVAVSRGADLSSVFKDPNNPSGGLILCQRALKSFNIHKNESKYQSEQGRFELAMKSAIKIRKLFLKNSEYIQNELASYHTSDSNRVPRGSPFLSLTLNDPIAVYFAAGGIDYNFREIEPNRNGMVFQSSVNNESTIYPVIGGKVKNAYQYLAKHSMSDIGMAFSEELKVPMGELVIVGGFYFNNAIELKKALQKNPEQFRTVSDLVNMSSQMLDANKNSAVHYLPFHDHPERLKRQLGIDLENLN